MTVETTTTTREFKSVLLGEEVADESDYGSPCGPFRLEGL